MPRYVVNKVQAALNNQQKALKNSQIMVLGAAYKPDIDDVRESPALDVIGLLQENGAEVTYHDPYIPMLAHDNINLTSVPDLLDEVKRVDCVVIITNHSQYDYEQIYKNAMSIVDTRNALGDLGVDDPKVTRL